MTERRYNYLFKDMELRKLKLPNIKKLKEA